MSIFLLELLLAVSHSFLQNSICWGFPSAGFDAVNLPLSAALLRCSIFFFVAVVAHL